MYKFVRIVGCVGDVMVWVLLVGWLLLVCVVNGLWVVV